MSSQSKQLALIAITEMKVKADKISLEEHQRYFAKLASDHRIVLISFLLPAFWVGWQGGKQPEHRKWLSKWAKRGFFIALSKFRRSYGLK